MPSEREHADDRDPRALSGVRGRREAGVGGERERHAVAEVGEDADDVGADVAVLGQDHRLVEADGAGARIGGDRERARAAGEWHAPQLDAARS